MTRFDGKVAVVVGAGQTTGDTVGNGRATALLLARKGARVLCVDRDLGSAEATCALIAAEEGVAAAHRADVTSDADCASIPTAALDRWGRIDVLVNNVGIGTGDGPATRVTEESWDHILDVNLSGTWRTCKHVLPVMREQGSGAIVNVSSIAAVCSPDIVAYKTSKAGVNALTHALVLGAAKHGIRVNAVMPGLIDTPMAIEGIHAATGIDRDELRARRAAQVPLGRTMGTAWDVARAICFLASDDAAFISGAILPVDGGQSSRIG